MPQSGVNLEKRLRIELSQLRRQICAGDETNIMIWAVRGQLACSQRPLRDHPIFGGKHPIPPLPPEAKQPVLDWVQRVKDAEIRSIISLLEDAQLDRHYIRGGLNLHPEGLLGYYKSQGFEVRHFPMTDYERPPESEMERVLQAFRQLPKTVLLQCSAAIDRTTPVAAYIVSNMPD